MREPRYGVDLDASFLDEPAPDHPDIVPAASVGALIFWSVVAIGVAVLLEYWRITV